MTEYAQLETKEAVRAALLEGRPVECRHAWQQPAWLPLVVDREELSDDWQFRAPLPAVQAIDAAVGPVSLNHVDTLKALRGDCNPEGDDWDRQICAALDVAISALAATPAPPEKAEARYDDPDDGECPRCGAPTDPDYGHVGQCAAPAETREAVAEQVERLAAMLCEDFKGPLEVRYDDRCQAGKDRWREEARRILRSFATPPPAPDLLAKMGELVERMQRDANAGASMFAGVHDMLLALKDSMRRHANELRALIDGAQK